MDIDQKNENVCRMNWSATIKELIALPPARVQKVYGMHKSAVVFEIYAHTCGRLFLVYDFDHRHKTLHVQKEPLGKNKSTSSIILLLKKHATGRLLWFVADSEHSFHAIVAAREFDLSLIFSSDGIQLVKEAAGAHKIPEERVQATFVHNHEAALLYTKNLHQHMRDHLINERKKSLNKALKKKMTLLKNLHNDVAKAEHTLATKIDAELLQANFHRLKKGMKNIELVDYTQDPEQIRTITLDACLSPAQLLEQAFNKIKRAKRGLAHIIPRIESLNNDIALIESDLKSINEDDPQNLVFRPIEKVSPRMSPKNKIARRLPYRSYLSSDNIALWVGKSAQDNDELSLHYAKGNEWWFHCRLDAGSHVVVKSNVDALPENTFLEAAMLAAHFSRHKHEPVSEIIYTRCKYLRKPKGLAKGQVLVTQEKSLLIRMDQEKIAALLLRLAS